MNVGFSVTKSSKDRYYCERFYWKSIVLNKNNCRPTGLGNYIIYKSRKKKTSKTKNTNKIQNKVIYAPCSFR